MFRFLLVSMGMATDFLVGNTEGVSSVPIDSLFIL